jgi:hypothetical protein
MPPPSSTDREALIAALAEEARSGAPEAPEPEPEELLDYLAGRLAPEDEQRIARQLTADPAAARTLLDLAGLEDAGATAGERPADLAVLAGWRDFRNRLPEAVPRPRRPPVWLPAIAASLLVATMGLGLWVWRLQGELARPVANLRSLQLISGGRAGTDPAVEVPPGKPLRLVLAPAEPCPGYTAEVTEPSGERQMVEGLMRDEGGRVTFLLPRTESGLYTLRLVGCEPRRELEEQRFRITRSNGG